jgi:hypothetical protein
MPVRVFTGYTDIATSGLRPAKGRIKLNIVDYLYTALRIAR